jgi:ABC-type sugar transport system substrate-binding protein
MAASRLAIALLLAAAAVPPATAAAAAAAAGPRPRLRIGAVNETTAPYFFASATDPSGAAT